MTGPVKPYGDVAGDGMVQVSFTLPLEESETARQAALQLAAKMGLRGAQVVHMKRVGPAFTFFIIYGAAVHSVDPLELVVRERDFPLLSHSEINRIIRESLKRPLVVVGACAGSDAHTVGLDAILSLKGFAGDHGLEHFSELRVVNLGAQVEPGRLAGVVRREKADAVLVSQVVTQRDAHISHLAAVRRALVETGIRDGVVLVGGGPGLVPEQAEDLGYDRIFGRGTRPSEVASYLAWRVAGHGAAVAGREP